MNEVFVSDSQLGFYDVIEKKPAIEEGITGIDYVCGRTIATCDNKEDAQFIADAWNSRKDKK